ncbi:hypothetical protein NIES4071_34670 [Calothrix sp. NIES-4071]|nr:hypothetical protein NIES4071_34670 [Calothrix sp. NIES-4071]BAZ57786.1 hypothetical protein NIES4105_34600 [Calothrix sp. NIES-4105]
MGNGRPKVHTVFVSKIKALESLFYKLFTKGYKQPTSFPITASYPLEGGNGVILEFYGHLKNTQTGEQYTNSYIVVFKFREGKLILFREFFDSLKRQKYESHN